MLEEIADALRSYFKVPDIVEDFSFGEEMETEYSYSCSCSNYDFITTVANWTIVPEGKKRKIKHSGRYTGSIYDLLMETDIK